MRILVVCRVKGEKIAPFVEEQVAALTKMGVELDYFKLTKGGFLTYLKEIKNLKKAIRNFQPDLVHAHYGLSGFFANLQRDVPVITSYIGSDINSFPVFFFSYVSILQSKHNIFVSEKLRKKAKPRKNFSVIPYGFDLDLFNPIDKAEARKKLGLSEQLKMVLFGSSFQVKVKNPILAKSAVAALKDVQLFPLGGYKREEIPLLLNAADVALLTSYAEGSPQFIKEAMATNCPIVSTDVGDVRELIENIEGCYIASYEVTDVANKINQAFMFGNRTIARESILHLDNKRIAAQILAVYNNLK